MILRKFSNVLKENRTATVKCHKKKAFFFIIDAKKKLFVIINSNWFVCFNAFFFYFAHLKLKKKTNKIVNR